MTGNGTRTQTQKGDVQDTSNEAETPTVADQATEEGICPDCDIPLQSDSGTEYCEECGYVAEGPTIDRGPEWRAFDSSEREEKSRVGSAVKERFHDKGLSTTIGWKDSDANGNPLTQRKRKRMARLRDWNERLNAKDPRERTAKQGLGEVSRMTSALGLPDGVTEIASRLFKQALENDVLIGRSIEGIATASVSIAARISGVPRPYDTLLAVSRLDDMKRIKRDTKHVIQELELAVEPVSPDQYIPQFANELDVSQDHIREANRLIDELKGSPKISGYTPTGLAAAALFAAGVTTGKLITQELVADASGVTKVTIRNRYKLFIDADPQNDIDVAATDGKRVYDIAAKIHGEDGFDYEYDER